MDSNAELQIAENTAADNLRPLTTGEIFDRTFSVFRSHFWLFCGIAMVPALLSLLRGAIRLVLLRAMHLPLTTGEFSNVGLALLTIAWVLVTLAVYGASQAASTIAVSSVYLGRAATVESAYRTSLQHWLRYPLLILAQILSAGWVTVIPYIVMLFLLGTIGRHPGGLSKATIALGICGVLAFLSFPFSIYRYLRVSLAVPASVVEDLAIGGSLDRSKELMVDRKWRVFMVFLFLTVFYALFGGVIGFLFVSAIHGRFHMLAVQIATLVLGFAASLLLQPVGSISLCLIYFDERVRREAFDIEFMLQKLSESPASSQEQTAPSIDEGAGA